MIRQYALCCCIKPTKTDIYDKMYLSSQQGKNELAIMF